MQNALDPFAQSSYRCRFDWGRRGCREAAARGDALVIVDTLSFSTAAATATDRGGLIYPCAPEEDVAAFAARIGGVAAVSRADVPAKGRYSLSPLTYLDLEPGTRVVLASPNGALCSRYSRHVSARFAGALVNARATAAAISRLLAQEETRCVTVLACGERWGTPSEDGPLRPALEDYLGAGAILASLVVAKSPEARACEGAFLHLRDSLSEALWECGSGQELRAKGFEEDVRIAAQLDLYDSATVMRGECLQRPE